MRPFFCSVTVAGDTHQMQEAGGASPFSGGLPPADGCSSLWSVIHQASPYQLHAVLSMAPGCGLVSEMGGDASRVLGPDLRRRLRPFYTETELVIESFFPADARTAAVLRRGI